MIQYDYTQKHIQIVQLTARKCLCSTACSVLTRGFKTQIAIAHLACEQQMTCKVSCTLQILSWFLILYLTDLLGMHPTEGHCWYTLSACLKLRHYKHSKKTMQEGVAHGKSGKLSRPTLICIGNMGKLWPHIAHIHLGHNNSASWSRLGWRLGTGYISWLDDNTWNGKEIEDGTSLIFENCWFHLVRHVLRISWDIYTGLTQFHTTFWQIAQTENDFFRFVGKYPKKCQPQTLRESAAQHGNVQHT